MSKLGDNAKERIEAADLWSKKYLSTDAYNAIANMAATAEGVKALEEIMSLSKNKPLPNTNTVVDVELDDRDLQSMMADPRYWKEGSKDQAYIAKVTNLYQKKYG
jgi:predicted adenine nucleotide alpha hydrolase (AANH) superfamily ATPase